MKTPTLSELDRRTLLKGAAGVIGAGAVGLDGPEAEAQDKQALKDAKVSTEMVSYKNGGATINAFLARPRTDAKVGCVILIPGIFGVTEQMKEVTAQVAQAGLAGLAIDFYSRAGGAPKVDDISKLFPFVTENAPDKQIVSDALAGIDYLKKQTYSNGKVGITGFCMGGRITLLVAAQSPEIAAASPYYGPVRARGDHQMAPMDVANNIKAPVQGHYGGKDTNPPPDDVRAFYAKLKETSPNSEYFIYETANHAFHDYSRPTNYHPEAAAQAWGRTLAFFQKHLK